MKNIITSIISAGIVAIIVVTLALSGQKATPAPSSSPDVLGALETTKLTLGQGAEIYPSNRDGGLIFRGALARTISSSPDSISVGNIIGYSTLLLTPTVSNVIVSLPASTTFPSSYLPRPGDRTQIVIFNASSTAGNQSLLGFAPNTGTIVQVASTTNAGTASTTGQTGMVVNIMRKPNTDLLFMFAPFK